MLGLLNGRTRERIGYELYGAAVAAARAPVFYTEMGVPDTLDGRFDLVTLHAFLVIRRLAVAGRAGRGLSQAVFDAMFNDMDVTLREMGVGDLGVGRRVRAMWEGFHGRSAAYKAALDADDRDGLAQALARNVWRDPASAGAGELADAVIAQAAHLAAQPDSELLAGRIAFRQAA